MLSLSSYPKNANFKLTDVNTTPTAIQFQARYKRRKNKNTKDMSLSTQIYRGNYISYQLYIFAKVLKRSIEFGITIREMKNLGIWFVVKSWFSVNCEYMLLSSINYCSFTFDCVQPHAGRTNAILSCNLATLYNCLQFLPKLYDRIV